MDTIQIEITNACPYRCANCTRLVGHYKKPFMMTPQFFEKAVDSLIDFPKMIGVMGGEPLLHPQFETLCAILRERVERKRCGLWTTLPAGKEQLAAVIAETFGNIFVNDHTRDELLHTPLLVSGDECFEDKHKMWYHIDKCWVQNNWSASITPKGGFFCEVAAAFDMVFDGPGGWPIEPGWWRKTPKDFVEQMERYCTDCGAPYPLTPRRDSEVVDDASPRWLQRLEAAGSPKLKQGNVAPYQGGLDMRNHRINSFRRDFGYLQEVASKYNLQLVRNRFGFLEPQLGLPALTSTPCGEKATEPRA